MAETDDNGTPFLEKKVDINFCDPNTLHDRVLIVEEKKFYVNSNHLSMLSEYFYGLFKSNLQEKEQKEIELKDIGSDEFEIYLKMLYPLDIQVPKDNLGSLIKLSNMLLTPIISQKCVKFLENPSIFESFKLEDLLGFMDFSSSETLKAHILKSVFTDKGLILEPNIVKIVFANNFANLKETPISVLILSNKSDKINAMCTFIQLLQYDIPVFEEWFADNFARLMLTPLSVKNVRLLMEKLDNFSKAHKKKLERVFKECSDLIEEKQSSARIEQGLRNFLPEFSFLLYKNNPKTLLEKSYNLIKDFLCGMQIAHIQAVFDKKLKVNFAKRNSFEYIELVLDSNLIETKTTMTNFLKEAGKKSIEKKMELFKLAKSSTEVANFVRESLAENKSKQEVILKAIFG